MEKIKRLPYGISDFRQVMREGKFYVDKTMYIPVMEDTDNFLFLIRPRRFGKSVFLSMLRCYYDINERESFGETFKGLWIADHPTPERGKFQVLHMDFSRVVGSLETLEEDLGDYCSLMLDDFAERYAPFYGPDYVNTIRTYKSFRTKFSYIDNQAKRKGYPLYLIIDEYDNFTNTVLNEKGEAVYHALTHASGFYRDVFKLFKGMFARILMMGVSPVTMDDLTSGYNIASNISMRPEFNLMLGFSEDDVRQMIRYYQGFGMIKQDEEELIEEMKPWYDNYCFAQESVDTDPKMFNCDMVLYYLNRIIQTGKSPREMIDPNTRTDYTKMKKLIQLDKLDGNRLGLIHEIAENGYTYGELVESFPAEDLTRPQMFVSLLFYYGMLTIGGMFGAKVKLIIPNNNVRRQYYGYLKEEYQKIAYVDTMALSNAYDQAAINGDWQPMLTTIADIYRETTSVRQLIEGERNLQGFMNAYLTLCPYYLTAPEVELNHGFCDFFLMPDMHHYPMIRHSYILELKYLKTDATEAEAHAQWQQAEAQIHQYAQGERVKLLVGDTQLHLLIMQIKGYETVRMGEVR